MNSIPGRQPDAALSALPVSGRLIRRTLLAAILACLVGLFPSGTGFCFQDEAPGTAGSEESKERSFSTGTAFFDDASLSGGLYYIQRDRRRLDPGTGRYQTNLDHASLQASAEFNSGLLQGVAGIDFGVFGSLDARNRGAVDHEMNFVPWNHPWGMDWSKTNTRDGLSVYKALLKFKAGPAWLRAGYFQPSGPGVLGVNWSFLPGTYQGIEAGADFGNFSLSGAMVNAYKSPWYLDMYHFRKGDGQSRIDYLWSMGGRYAFDFGLMLEGAYGESEGYLWNAHLKSEYALDLNRGKLELRYHLYAMGDRDDSGKNANDNFDGPAFQHFLAAAYRQGPWIVRLEGTYTLAPFSHADQVGFFAYRLTNPSGSSRGAYDVWWDARSDWNHHQEKAVFLGFERQLDDLLPVDGFYAGLGGAIGWDGQGHGVSQRLKEWAFNFDLGYVRRDGPLEGAYIKFHYTEYRNGTAQPDWGPYKNAFQNERDFKILASIPFSL